MSVPAAADRVTGSAWLLLSAQGESAELISVACGLCGPCRRGCSDHCMAVDQGNARTVVAWQGRDKPDLRLLAIALLVATLIEQMRGAGPRLGILGAAGVLEALHDIPAFVALSPVTAVTDQVQDQGAEYVRRLSDRLRGGNGPSRAPDAVIALDGDLALAARLVRRGGTIAALTPSLRPVPLSVLVQRELSVCQTRDVVTTAAGSELVAEVGGWVRERTVGA